MNREQFAHVLRAAATIGDDAEIIVIGSQAILGTYPEEVLPLEALRSMEADIAFRDDEDETKADRVDGAIGELSPFHELHGYYGQGVSISTAILPDGWEDRLVVYENADDEQAACIDPHDLVVSKLVAGREKDIEFATALIAADLVSPELLLERAEQLDQPGVVTKQVRSRIERCTRRATGPPG